MTGANEAVPEVSPEAAVQKVAAGTPLIDVREQSEWHVSHAPDAHLIPLGELEARLSELPRDREILVICQSGARSERAVQFLRRSGFDAATVPGGMLAWSAIGGEVDYSSQDHS